MNSQAQQAAAPPPQNADEVVARALADFGLQAAPPPEAAREAAAQKPPPPPDGARDFRGVPFFTIDGDDARDFDDAVFCAREKGGFRLWVGVADVAHYVRPGGVLDEAARERGNSVYLPGLCAPMLPEPLADDLCSLRPDCDRACLGCEMLIGRRGGVRGYRFFHGTMRSRRRLTYDEAQEMGEEGASIRNNEKDLQEALGALRDAARALRAHRKRRGGFELNSPETTASINGGEVRVQEAARGESWQWIEEAMLAANVCAADFLARGKQPTLFRVHRRPTAEHLATLQATLAPFGLSVPAQPRPADFGKVLAEAAAMDAQLARALTPAVLGAMRRAEYSPDNDGHFALGFSRYTHFTSPIRRYPDLLTHRAVHARLRGQSYQPEPSWRQLGEHCSATEQVADKVGWEAMSRLACFSMQARVGEVFSGYISGVAAFGVFIAVPGTGLEGLARIARFPGYYRHDAVATRFVRDDGQSLKLGDKARVKLLSANAATGKADFAPV